MKRHNLILSTSTILMLGGTFAAMAQDPVAVKDSAFTAPTVSPIFMNPTFYLLALLFIVMFIVIVVLSRSLSVLIRNAYGATEAAEVQGNGKSKTENKPSFWQDIDRKILTKAVPIEQEKDILFEHGYDGIHELDNDLPPWWKWGFYCTIVFAFVYLAHYHLFRTGKLQREEYKQEIVDAEAAKQELMAKNANFVTKENVTVLSDAAALGDGKNIFMQNCLACHGASGEGLVGPNLTDEFWLHGGGIKNVFNTISEGVPAKGMISWKAQLSPKQIQSVASYVLSLAGTSPANAKAPQGDKWVDPNAQATAGNSKNAVPDSTSKK